jgi:ABC-type proline/glycine betaine transport system permease subunit
MLIEIVDVLVALLLCWLLGFVMGIWKKKKKKTGGK